MRILDSGELQFDIGLAIDGRTPVGDKDIAAVRAMRAGARVMAKHSDSPDDAQRYRDLVEATDEGLRHTNALNEGYFVLDTGLAEYGAKALETYRTIRAIPHADAVWAGDPNATAIERNYGQLCEAAGLPEPDLYSAV